MNFLAHVFLAGDTDEALVGALLGDFVKGKAKDEFAPAIRHAIELHRAIDAFTDSHELVLGAKRHFAPERRRMAGVLLDVVCDHYLARNWERFSNSRLDDFVTRVYGALHRYEHVLPERFRKMLPYMVREDWLAAYRELSWIEVTLERMAARRGSRLPLAAGMVDLRRNYVVFEEMFMEFFPSLILHVEKWRPNKNSLLDTQMPPM